jgi:hypothetical protein
MILNARHRKIARAVWECGGRLDEAAAQGHVRPDTLRRWLAEPEFRALIAQDAVEPLLQTTSAVLRWAPVAVARLIQDLQGEAPGEARQAAREILKLALETQRELAAAGERRQPCDSGALDPAASSDPLTQSVAMLPDDQLTKLLAILNDTPKGAAP